MSCDNISSNVALPVKCNGSTYRKLPNLYLNKRASRKLVAAKHLYDTKAKPQITMIPNITKRTITISTDHRVSRLSWGVNEWAPNTYDTKPKPQITMIPNITKRTFTISTVFHAYHGV